MASALGGALAPGDGRGLAGLDSRDLKAAGAQLVLILLHLLRFEGHAGWCTAYMFIEVSNQNYGCLFIHLVLFWFYF